MKQFGVTSAYHGGGKRRAGIYEPLQFIDDLPMEPSSETMAEIGRLCVAWAFLEGVTERTIWGILDVDEKIGPVITYRLDMRGRWALLMDWASRRHVGADLIIRTQCRCCHRKYRPEHNRPRDHPRAGRN
jgi:hypothetical protein